MMPQAKHVGAAVDRQPADLLGRHVRELALDQAGQGPGGAALRLDDAEVDELDLTLVRDDDVLRADVAVDQVERLARAIALVVGVVERLADLEDDVAGLGRAEPAVVVLQVVEDGAQVAPRHVLLDDEVAALDLTEVEDLGDVRVAQLTGDLRLVDEHGDEVAVVGDLRQQHLDRDHALEPGGALRLGAEHLRHAAVADPLEQRVLAERDRLRRYVLDLPGQAGRSLPGLGRPAW